MAKFCTKCLEDKELSEFQKCSRNPDGLQYRCRFCQSEASKVSRAKRDKSEEQAVKRVWYQRNRDISIARAKKYHEDHPEWSKEQSSKRDKTWRQRNPEKAKALAIRTAFNRRFKNHGISIEQYNALKENQKSRCAICGVVPDGGYGGLHDGFHIDHCHASGRVRGLLCKHCNVGIGMLKESEDIFQKAIEYLRSHK